MATVIDANRFQDKNMVLSQFADEIFVECPKCEKRAVVQKEEPKSYFSKRILKCPNCSYFQRDKNQLFNIELNCHCANCAAEIKIGIKNAGEKKEIIAVKCSKCGQTENYKPRNILIEWKYETKSRPSESYFGLPLWLAESFRENDIWAFNYKHLEYLKQYISAGLRERSARTGWTMVEKLPTWMTSGKNRDKIIKIISKLERV